MSHFAEMFRLTSQHTVPKTSRVAMVVKDAAEFAARPQVPDGLIRDQRPARAPAPMPSALNPMPSSLSPLPAASPSSVMADMALPRRDTLNVPLAPLPEIGKGFAASCHKLASDSLNDFMESNGSRLGFPSKNDITAFKKVEETDAGARHEPQPSREASPEEFVEFRVTFKKKKPAEEIGVCIATYKTDSPSLPHITWVKRKGLAGRSGQIRVGDMIVSVDGKEVHSCEDVRNGVCGKVGYIELRCRRRRETTGPPPTDVRRPRRHVDEEGNPY